QSERVIVHGTFDKCPLITALAVAPDSAQVGDSVAVGAAATDPKGRALTTAWTSPSGSFADATAANTTYTCADPGVHTLTATVTSVGGLCSDSFGVDVTCTPAPDAGASGTGGRPGAGGADAGAGGSTGGTSPDAGAGETGG